MFWYAEIWLRGNGVYVFVCLTQGEKENCGVSDREDGHAFFEDCGFEFFGLQAEDGGVEGVGFLDVLL